MFGDCDYVMDERKAIFIVNGYRHPPHGIYVTKVYEPAFDGDRLNRNGLRYRKVVKDESELVPLRRVTAHWTPCIVQPRQLHGPWKHICEALLRLGVPAQEVRIFGATLVGFPLRKDVDFIIYGLENLKAVKVGIEDLKEELGVSGLSLEHIRYQAKKFEATHDPRYTTFEKTLANKWSSLQVKKGVATTLRFALRPEEVTDLFRVDLSQRGKMKTLHGEVVEDFLTNVRPRIFTIKTRKKEYTVKTLYWAYQACVKKGDLVTVRGDLMDDGTLVLRKKHHGIRIEDA